MLEKLLDQYIESKLPDKGTPISAHVGNYNKPAPTETREEKVKLEKKILNIFGILLQLIVFYLPLVNMIFRGKAIASIMT